MPPPYYTPVQKNRFFAPSSKKYSQIQWGSLSAVVQAFHDRIRGWYIAPIQSLQKASGENSFAVAGLTCLLIDMLSQYVPIPAKPPGALPGYAFKEFVRRHTPLYAAPLPVHLVHHRSPTQTYTLTTLEDVIYHALRCGILHEAHATLYCGIYGLEGKRFRFYKARYTKYASNGRKCLTVVIDPHLLFADTLSAFQGIIRDLQDPNAAFEPLRRTFRQKFLEAFGIPL